MRQEPVPQLNLPFSRDAHALADLLARSLRRPLTLILTDNATSMLSVRRRDGVLVVRLHRMFAGADNAVLDEIASFILKGKGALPLFREFIRENRVCISARKPRQQRIVTNGRWHDLAPIFEAVNREYFDGRVQSSITWSAAAPRRYARKRTLGSYSVRTNAIRISRLLDRRDVPLYFIAYVVYHEMLHADLGISETEGRRAIHTREFRRREKLFRDYARASAWERDTGSN